ncbi:MAG: PEGA domain-containing protein [Planctomycetota bacterium]
MRSFAILFLMFALGACVERRLHIRTEPEGATVRVNGVEVGVSPVVWRFDHYGKVRVEVEKAGHKAEERIVRLKAPAREYYTLAGFFIDVTYPGTLMEDHEVEFVLGKERRMTDAEVDEVIASLAESSARLRGQAAEGPAEK